MTLPLPPLSQLSLPPLAKLTIIYTTPPSAYGGVFSPYNSTTVDYYEGSMTSAREALELWQEANPGKNVWTTSGWPLKERG